MSSMVRMVRWMHALQQQGGSRTESVQVLSRSTGRGFPLTIGVAAVAVATTIPTSWFYQETASSSPSSMKKRQLTQQQSSYPKVERMEIPKSLDPRYRTMQE